MVKVSRFVVLALALVLLVNQSLAFAVEHLHGTKSQIAAVASDPSRAPMSEKGNTRPSDAQCSNGCHFVKHFVGQIGHGGIGWLVAMGAEMAANVPLTRIQAASLEVPYRPPRLSPRT